MLERVTEFFKSIYLAKPGNLTLLELVPVLFFILVIFWVLYLLFRARQTHGSRYSLFGTFKFWTLLILFTAVTALALTDPYTSKASFVVKRGNVEVVFLIDYSLSMFLKDTGLVRIDIATREIKKLFASRIITDGDKVALYVFGADSLRRTLMTSDFNMFLRELSLVGRPNTLIGNNIYWSSDVASALEWTSYYLRRQDMIAEHGEEIKGYQLKPRDYRLVFMFTDGGGLFNSNEDGSNEESPQRLSGAIEKLNQAQLMVYPVGIGTRSGLPMVDALSDYEEGVQYDDRLRTDLGGQISMLDVTSLEYIADATHSTRNPFLIEDGGTSATGYMGQAMNDHRSTAMELVADQEREDLWLYCLFVALFLFIVGLLITRF